MNLSRRARTAWLLALFLVVAFGPIVAPLTAQPGSRLALTAALAEHHTVDITGYPIGVDRATYEGHLRSDKAPAQPVIAVPVYEVGRALGMESYAHLRQVRNLGGWWVTFWTSFLPFVALVVLMFLLCTRYAPLRTAFAVAVGLGVCTMMLPQSVSLYGSALAALTAYAAWVVLDAGTPSAARLAAVGALAAIGVAAEYETGIIFVVLAAVVLWQVRERIIWFVLGALGPVVLAGWYQAVAFGRPWRTAHAYYATAALREQIVGYELQWRGVTSTFFGGHGLLLTNSIVLVGIAAAVIVARSDARVVVKHAAVALVIAGMYLLLCVVWKGTPALEEPGPRYMIPAIPFLAVPLAVAWPKVYRVALFAMALSGIVAVGAATTGNLVAHQEAVLPQTLERVAHLRFWPTVWTMGLGWPGLLLHLATVVLVGSFLIASLRAPQAEGAPARALVGADEPV